MLYIVLVLVLAAFGLLVAALTTANTLWAWISVVVSVVAATLLVMDWVSGRRAKARAGEPVRPRAVTVGGPRHHRDEPSDVEPLEDDDDLQPEPMREPMSNLDFEPPVKLELPSGPEDVRTVVTEPVDEPSDEERTSIAAVQDDLVQDDLVQDDLVQDDFVGEPGEEPTDASDLLVVAGLNVEVRVVDEHPRYHLATCVWLANRPTIPVAVSEARQLGFTPCARCGPDATLAARHRARAK
ncbi:hypothetical protein [Actinophytocola sp.]|uniref:hypothetical protein n=1 Tax=Actinophytocola sp. TaxID=1872138 RepID=UPI00389A7B4A